MAAVVTAVTDAYSNLTHHGLKLPSATTTITTTTELPTITISKQSHCKNNENDDNDLSVINATLLLNNLEKQVQQAKKRYQIRKNFGILFVVIFMIFWLLCIPMALSASEDWTYQSSWYYSIQAGFGVGYGSIRVDTHGMELLLSFHIFLGSLFVVYLVATFISWSIERAADKTTKKNRGGEEEGIGKLSLGQHDDLGQQRFFVATILYILVLIMGVLYGSFRENWTFPKSLLFAVSTCQTSGLVSPDINPYKEDAYFNPLFVMFLVLLGVPIWAYKISALSLIIVRYNSNKKRIITVMDRRRDAQAAILRIKDNRKGGGTKSDNANGCSDDDDDGYSQCQIDRFGFLTFWLLEQNLLCEETILNLMKEFDFLKEEKKNDERSDNTLSPQNVVVNNANDKNHHRRVSLMDNNNTRDDDDDVVPLWKINAHLQFLQLVELKLVDKNAWPSFLESIEMVEHSKRQKFLQAKKEGLKRDIIDET